jgi:hypothetical protein
MKRVWVVENAIPLQQLPYIPPFVENAGVRYLLGDETADWPEEAVRRLCDAFCVDEYQLTVLPSPAALERHLKTAAEPPHIVIFDWEGPGFGDDINVAAIEKVLATTFSYVQVYTHLGADAAERHLGNLRQRYGDRLLPARTKDDVGPADLRTHVTTAWENTIAGETADAVRERARAAVERLLIDLCSIRKSALAAMSKGDVNQFVGVVMAKLRDELGASGLEQLETIVKGGGAAEAADDLRRLQSAFYYYFPQDDLVRTGDIVTDEAGQYGMVMTPWCHLESFQKKTGGYLTVIDGCELKADSLKAAGLGSERVGASATASHGKAAYSFVVLPNVPKQANSRSELIDLALITHGWNTKRVEGTEGALRYSSVKTHKRVCTLTETFSGAVVSHLAKTISSLGIPDFPQFEIDRLTGLLK